MRLMISAFPAVVLFAGCPVRRHAWAWRAPPPIFARARRYPLVDRHREITDGSDRRCSFRDEMLGHIAILKNLGGSDGLRQVWCLASSSVSPPVRLCHRIWRDWPGFGRAKSRRARCT